MRLFTRFLIAHLSPVLVVTLALGLALTALVRIRVVLTKLNETEHATLHDEGALHRAAWTLDVAMRHGHAACARGEPSDASVQRIEVAAAELERTLRSLLPVRPHMDAVASGYLAAAASVLAGDACAGLLGEAESRRARLDEELTNLWVERLDELHRAVAKKDEAARSVAVTAILAGVPLALASLVLAVGIARRFASQLEGSLAGLSATARRIGGGDLDTPSTATGPAELVAFAGELDRMRARLQQLEALKQGFLASVSHELRTPLSKIREALALLQDGAVGPLDGRQLRVVQIARVACEREIRMVTTLLDLSRLRAGSPIQLEGGGSIDRALDVALADERPDATDRGVTLSLEAVGEPRACRLDPVLMSHAIANLVRNAVSVSNAGQEVRLRRTFERRTGSEDLVACVTVSDEGPGIPEEIRHEVFDAFVTRPVPRSSKAFGVGIGLALAREVAVAHGGELEVAETSPQGTTFRMTIPLDQPPQPAAKAARSLGIEPTSSYPRADDDPA
jgi:two-component system sensor histidine kinase GlrK